MSKLCPFCQKANKTVAHFCFNCGGILGDLSHPIDFVLNRRYRIVSHLKQGGMATIYKAEDLRDNLRHVAIKEMATDNEEIKEKFTEWFEREMQILSNLRHHGIPDFKDHFTAGGRYYLVMEFIPGKNLDDLQKESASAGFPENVVLKWAFELSDILDYLHSQSPPVIHRDIKPGNIIARNDGKLMLVDFGIARFFSGTKTGTRIGTLGYIAPEHYKGQPEPRSDLYSLGVTLYQMLTGIDPASEVPYNLPLLRSVKPDLSSFTLDLVSKLITLDKENRVKNAMELLTSLKEREHPGQDRIAQIILGSFTPPPARPSSLSSTLPVKPPRDATTIISEKEEEKKTSATPTEQQWSPRRIFYAAPKTPRKGKEEILGRDGSKMVLIDEHRFMMGASMDDEALAAFEKPAHPMRVPPFYIDKTAVTAGQFARFINESGYKFKNLSLLNLEQDRRPAVFVTWYDALFYAAWAGKRLPLEAEWELAARGTDGRKYPWGNTWDTKRLNCAHSGFGHTVAAGTFPGGNSPYGCADMLGNVWEWTLDALVGYPYPGPSSQRAEFISVRGGGFRTDRSECRCTMRTKRPPSFFDRDLGFRCAITVDTRE